MGPPGSRPKAGLSVLSRLRASLSPLPSHAPFLFGWEALLGATGAPVGPSHQADKVSNPSSAASHGLSVASHL